MDSYLDLYLGPSLWWDSSASETEEEELPDGFSPPDPSLVGFPFLEENRIYTEDNVAEFVDQLCKDTQRTDEKSKEILIEDIEKTIRCTQPTDDGQSYDQVLEKNVADVSYVMFTDGVQEVLSNRGEKDSVLISTMDQGDASRAVRILKKKTDAIRHDHPDRLDEFNAAAGGVSRVRMLWCENDDGQQLVDYEQLKEGFGAVSRVRTVEAYTEAQKQAVMLFANYKYITKRNSTPRRMALFHGTGKGKTMAAFLIASQFIGEKSDHMVHIIAPSGAVKAGWEKFYLTDDSTYTNAITLYTREEYAEYAKRLAGQNKPMNSDHLVIVDEIHHEIKAKYDKLWLSSLSTDKLTFKSTSEYPEAWCELIDKIYDPMLNNGNNLMYCIPVHEHTIYNNEMTIVLDLTLSKKMLQSAFPKNQLVYVYATSRSKEMRRYLLTVLGNNYDTSRSSIRVSIEKSSVGDYAPRHITLKHYDPHHVSICDFKYMKAVTDKKDATDMFSVVSASIIDPYENDILLYTSPGPVGSPKELVRRPIIPVTIDMVKSERSRQIVKTEHPLRVGAANATNSMPRPPTECYISSRVSHEGMYIEFLYPCDTLTGISLKAETSKQYITYGRAFPGSGSGSLFVDRSPKGEVGKAIFTRIKQSHDDKTEISLDNDASISSEDELSEYELGGDYEATVKSDTITRMNPFMYQIETREKWNAVNNHPMSIRLRISDKGVKHTKIGFRVIGGDGTSIVYVYRYTNTLGTSNDIHRYEYMASEPFSIDATHTSEDGSFADVATERLGAFSSSCFPPSFWSKYITPVAKGASPRNWTDFGILLDKVGKTPSFFEAIDPDGASFTDVSDLDYASMPHLVVMTATPFSTKSEFGSEALRKTLQCIQITDEEKQYYQYEYYLPTVIHLEYTRTSDFGAPPTRSVTDVGGFRVDVDTIEFSTVTGSEYLLNHTVVKDYYGIDVNRYQGKLLFNIDEHTEKSSFASSVSSIQYADISIEPSWYRSQFLNEYQFLQSFSKLMTRYMAFVTQVHLLHVIRRFLAPGPARNTTKTRLISSEGGILYYPNISAADVNLPHRTWGKIIMYCGRVTRDPNNEDVVTCDDIETALNGAFREYNQSEQGQERPIQIINLAANITSARKKNTAHDDFYKFIDDPDACGVVIYSKKDATGTDMKNTRAVYMCGWCWSNTAIDQAKARALRTGSSVSSEDVEIYDVTWTDQLVANEKSKTWLLSVQKFYNQVLTSKDKLIKMACNHLVTGGGIQTTHETHTYMYGYNADWNIDINKVYTDITTKYMLKDFYEKVVKLSTTHKSERPPTERENQRYHQKLKSILESTRKQYGVTIPYVDPKDNTKYRGIEDMMKSFERGLVTRDIPGLSSYAELIRSLGDFVDNYYDHTLNKRYKDAFVEMVRRVKEVPWFTEWTKINIRATAMDDMCKNLFDSYSSMDVSIDGTLTNAEIIHTIISINYDNQREENISATVRDGVRGTPFDIKELTDVGITDANRQDQYWRLMWLLTAHLPKQSLVSVMRSIELSVENCDFSDSVPGYIEDDHFVFPACVGSDLHALNTNTEMKIWLRLDQEQQMINFKFTPKKHVPIPGIGEVTREVVGNANPLAIPYTIDQHDVIDKKDKTSIKMFSCLEIEAMAGGNYRRLYATEVHKGLYRVFNVDSDSRVKSEFYIEVTKEDALYMNYSRYNFATQDAIWRAMEDNNGVVHPLMATDNVLYPWSRRVQPRGRREELTFCIA